MALRGFLLVVLAALAGHAGTARADVHVVQGARYRLHYEGARVDADEALRILEAAWPSLEAFFGVAPKLAPDERLTVRYYASREGWVRGIRRDGTAAPGSAGGYYWPGTRTAHLYRQPTRYFTRTLLLHEATHQFHYLARTRNRGPAAAWYTEGVAEHLSWHRWDGTRLVLGVVPGVSLKDYPAKALAELEAPDYDLAAVVAGEAHASRAVSWALFRYLATGRDGRPLPRFETFCRKVDRGGRVWPLFRAAFGSAAKLHARLLAWLRAHQTPWAQVFNQWEQTGDEAFVGHAGVVSACRLKRPAASLSAVVELPVRGRRWRAGLLLHWTSNDDYTVALVSRRGLLAVDRRVDGRWQRLHASRSAPATAGRRRMRAQREDGRVALFVDGARVGAWALPGTALGLALDNAEVRFREVRWRPPER